MKWLLILLILPFVFAECVEPPDGMKISESVLFCSDTYDVPSGLSVIADNVILDCGTGVLRGIAGESEIGLKLDSVNNVTVRNCNILTFNQGLYLKNVTNSLIEDNAFLKNRIGIRMLDSYENIIRDNSDKSHQLAVSAINSKYNIVMLGNKNVERGFCEVNACNEFRDMNPCESGDFYCSKKCAAENDDDCKTPAIKEPEKVELKEDIVAKLEEEVRRELEEQPVEMTFVPKNGLSILTQLFIYIIAYLLAFTGLQFYLYKKR